MLPVIPKHNARRLWTMPMIVAQKGNGISAAAMTKNSREKLVAIPPGI